MSSLVVSVTCRCRSRSRSRFCWPCPCPCPCPSPCPLPPAPCPHFELIHACQRMFPDLGSNRVKATSPYQLSASRYHTEPDRAVDGNLRTCARTKHYWAVTMERRFWIKGVLITSRPDCCGESSSPADPIVVVSPHHQQTRLLW